MSADLTWVDHWIFSTLDADATLSATVGQRIYADLAPQSTTGAMVIFSFLGGSDKTQTLGTRFTHALYLIRVVTQGSSYDAIKAAADRIDDVLVVPTSGIYLGDIRIAACNREQPHQRKDMENGVPYVYLGGFYRVRYQPSGL